MFFCGFQKFSSCELLLTVDTKQTDEYIDYWEDTSVCQEDG